ncbi:MAG: thymidine phosphorylase [Planctomycetes bacterium]|nr:thymidine phosphorylase [Planctomycetota bacterium]
MSAPPPPPAAALIARKRDGERWTDAEIAAIVAGIADGSWSDAQVGALAMALWLRGADERETTRLTLAMRDSGQTLDTSSLGRPCVDKHSTGGVGDKVSLLLAPWIAAAGVAVPMISGRGLGHTGGTLDKLDSIPGYRVDLAPREIVRIASQCGFAMAAANHEIAPADRRLYAVRDETGTVASIPMIVSSILAKKLAEGIDGLVLDVKVGRAAFLRERADAERLARALVATGNAAGVRTTALLTDMDRPLGRAIGNALEVAEVVACLHGQGPPDLVELTLALGAEMLLLAGVDGTRETARDRLVELLARGAVRERMLRNVELQGGDPAFVDDPSRLPSAPHVEILSAPPAARGVVVDVDPLRLGLAAVGLGAGRRRASDAVDPRVGIVLRTLPGDRVAPGTPLAEVHAAHPADADAARDAVLAAFRFGDAAPPLPSGPVLDRVSGTV